MDNLPAHKPEEIRESIEQAGARLPPYSPDLNPIENSFATLKSHLRKHKERTIPALYDRIGEAIGLISPTQCANYFKNAGYAST